MSGDLSLIDWLTWINKIELRYSNTKHKIIITSTPWTLIPFLILKPVRQAKDLSKLEVRIKAIK